jgi:hypothetical protein
MRGYKVKQKSTGLYVRGLKWEKKNKDGRKRFFHTLDVGDKSRVITIADVNIIVNSIIRDIGTEILDDLELITYDIPEPVEIKGPMQITHVRKKIEAKIIVEKLKNGR